MFYKCESLMSLPNISIRNISEVNMNDMFNECLNLLNIPPEFIK